MTSASEFTDVDFAAFLTYAGSPPESAHLHRTRVASSKDLRARLYYVELCDSFCSEYFNKHREDSAWIDFYREFLEWHREKLNEKH